MAVWRIDIPCAQHLRCKVQHLSIMPKLSRTTFRNECMDLKWNSTLVHHSLAMVNRWPTTLIPFYHKIHVKKMKGKQNFWVLKVIRIVFFGYKNMHWRLKAIKAVELVETFVLTGYGSHSSKRVNHYGCSKNRYPLGVTSTVQGATFVHIAETAPYDFYKWVHEFEKK